MPKLKRVIQPTQTLQESDIDEGMMDKDNESDDFVEGVDEGAIKQEEFFFMESQFNEHALRVHLKVF